MRRFVSTNRRNVMLLFLILGVVILLASPVLAAYQQPYYSHAYGNLSKIDKQKYDAAMKTGDAYYQKGDYMQAVINYNAAWQYTGGYDYPSLAAVGQAEIALYKQDKKKGDLSRARNFLEGAEDQLSAENPGGYEQNDLMAKIRTSQADMNRLEGNEKAALIDETEAADYRRKADAASGDNGLPLSPLVPLMGLGAAGAIMLYRDRRKSG